MNREKISEFTNKQLYNFLLSENDVTPFVEEALDRTLKCFLPNKNKYYNNDEKFSVFHSGQHSIYLYYLSNTIFKKTNDTVFASKVYYLNKILHSVDWFYEIELPSYWGVEHPVGSVLGRAAYSDGLWVYQGCTVGGSNREYPRIGKNLIMYSNSKVLGKSKVGNNVILSSDTTIINKNVPDNCIVFSENSKLIIKEYSEIKMLDKISEIWDKSRVR